MAALVGHYFWVCESRYELRLFRVVVIFTACYFLILLFSFYAVTSYQFQIRNIYYNRSLFSSARGRNIAYGR